MDLTQLKSVTDRTVLLEDTWLSQIPSAESMPIPHRRVNVDVLRSLLDATQRRRAIQVFYQSMNPIRTEPTWRWISPHAFGNDGLRWHVRAFCHIGQKFKDFLLSRCLEAKEEQDQGAKAIDDIQWDEFFNVVLIPNPALSQNQQTIVAQEYCMENGRIAIPIRKSLLYYFRKRFRLEVAKALDVVKETPVVVESLIAFEAALAEAD